MESWIISILVFLFVYMFGVAFVGITPGSLIAMSVPAFLFALTTLFALKWVGVIEAFPFLPINKQAAMYATIILLVVGIFTMGWFANFLPFLSSASVTGTTVTGLTTGSQSQITAACDKAKLCGDSACPASTIDVNAFDLASTTPGTPVDLTTGCWIFRNGVYVGQSADTSAATLNAAVGDSFSIYCGGTSYYCEPVENQCIKSSRDQIKINCYGAAAESDMQVTGYDKSMNSLSSGTATQDDYYITLGASATDKDYFELMVNSNTKTYQLGAIGTAKFTNITRVEPLSFNFNGKFTSGSYSWKVVGTPQWAQSVAILVNETATTTAITKDYTTYRLQKAGQDAIILLNKWEYVTIPVEIESSSSDPIAHSGTSSLNGYAVLFMDAQKSISSNNDAIYTDIWDHATTTQSDVGLAETETSPLGKQVGALVEVR